MTIADMITLLEKQPNKQLQIVNSQGQLILAVASVCCEKTYKEFLELIEDTNINYNLTIHQTLYQYKKTCRQNT